MSERNPAFFSVSHTAISRQETPQKCRQGDGKGTEREKSVPTMPQTRRRSLSSGGDSVARNTRHKRCACVSLSPYSCVCCPVFSLLFWKGGGGGARLLSLCLVYVCNGESTSASSTPKSAIFFMSHALFLPRVCVCVCVCARLLLFILFPSVTHLHSRTHVCHSRAHMFVNHGLALPHMCRYVPP